MAPQHTLSHGLPTALRLLGDPPRRVRYSRKEADEVQDSWIAPSATAIAEGDPHPTLTGCIVEQVQVTGPFGSSGEQVWEYDLTSLGDARDTKPTKILNRGKRRTLDTGWDERMLRYLSWHAEWKSCTAAASTDVITCTAHGYLNGQRVHFARLTGGTGLTPQSSTSLGTVYYVIDRTTNTFKVSLTAGGAAVDITVDMSAGQVIASEFALGAAHPDFPYLYLVDIALADDNNDWKIADVTYRGLEEDKPYKRIVTVNGQTMSTSSPIAWDFPDGSTDLVYRSVKLPQIQVVDISLTTATLATSSVPLSQSEGGSPPSPPSIRSITIYGDLDQLVYQWPAGWSLEDVSHVDTLSNPLAVSLQRRVYVYNWPVLLR